MGLHLQNGGQWENYYIISTANFSQLHHIQDLHVRRGLTLQECGGAQILRGMECEHHVVSAYSLWINGLVEGTNKILLHVLKRLCAPGLGEDEYEEMDWDTLPKMWPLHINDAVLALNTRILPALKFTPKELLLGLVVNTPPTPLSISGLELTPKECETQMAYVAQQRLDGYEAIVRHAVSRKGAFDRRMLTKKPGQVIFKCGQLVQIYRSDLDYTFKTERKLLPKWSQPRRICIGHTNVLSCIQSTTIAPPMLPLQSYNHD